MPSGPALEAEAVAAVRGQMEVEMQRRLAELQCAALER